MRLFAALYDQITPDIIILHDSATHGQLPGAAQATNTVTVDLPV